MNRFRERLAAFMYGRNGPDELYRFSWWVSLVLTIIICVLMFFSRIAGRITYIAALVVMILGMWRLLSRKVDKRRRENAAFLNFKRKIKSFFERGRNKRKYKDVYIYKKCPKCKNILRFPRVVGEHTVKCPCCSEKFDIEIR